MKPLPITLGLALGALLPWGASAQEPASPNDGRVMASPAIMEVVSQTWYRSSTIMSETEVRKLAEVVMADGRLDSDELDLIDELTVPRIRAINISPRSGTGRMMVVGTLSGENKRLLEQPMEAYYAALYGDGKTAKRWEELVRQSQISDGALERVRGFLANKTAAAAQASTVANVYEPARTLIKDWLAHNKALPAELQDRGNWLIFQSFEKGDAATDGKLPDFIYNWTKPKAP